jgi:lysophospholipase L1-like esterase
MAGGPAGSPSRPQIRLHFNDVDDDPKKNHGFLVAMSTLQPFLVSKVLQLAACLALSVAGGASAGDKPADAPGQAVLPAKVKRVVFVGDSITYAGMYVGFVEAYFVTRYPGRTIEFINLGLPSETVSGLTEEGHAGGKFPRPDLHERLPRVLKEARPDLIFACYGMNDGIYLPLNEERFGKFKEGMEWLHQQVTKAGAAIVHVTPPTFDEVTGGHAGYSAVLGKYSEWLLGQRAAAGWDVVNVHGPMDTYLAERRKRDPKFAYAGDGVHANDAGHWIIAKQILLHLGAKDVAELADGKAIVAAFRHGEEVLKLVQRRHELMKDAWLTATGHKRPGMKEGLPLAEAQSKAAGMEVEIRALVK